MAVTGNGPLAGVRVVELAGIGPAPFAAMLLADLGADVVRVDRPGGGGLAVDPAYDLTNRTKRSVLVDLKSADGPARVLDLAERADVLVEGFRPGVAERLGVGPAECHARNPALVYGRMTGWGQDGPLAHTAGHDIAYIAVTGALGMIGAAGQAPAVPANLVGDYAGGSLYLVIGVLAALQHARTGGSGQVVDAAIVDGTAHLTAMIHGMMAAGGWQDRRGANLLDGGCPFYGTYETSDGQYMAVGALEQQFYDTFTDLLGIADRAPARKDPARWGSCARSSPPASSPVRARSGRRSSRAPTPAWRPCSRCARPRTIRTSPPAAPSPTPADSSSPPPRRASRRPPPQRREAPRCRARTPAPWPPTGTSRRCSGRSPDGTVHDARRHHRHHRHHRRPRAGPHDRNRQELAVRSRP